MTLTETPQRVVSGVQASQDIHLGHYFGAIRHHIDWQHRAQCFFFVADYHTLTTVREPQELRRHTFHTAVAYLASGLDPEVSTFYRQSDVPEITELAWILSTICPMGILERAVSYKEHRLNSRSCDAGVFLYPVLMAADILILRANRVPVGRDQSQHLEMTREIARRFNHLYAGEERTVLLPPATDLSPMPFVIGTDGEKMSNRYGNTISILDHGEYLSDKVRRIKTDSKGREEPKNPDACTVYNLYDLVASDEDSEALAQRYRRGGIGYDEAKDMLIAEIEGFFAGVRSRYAKYAEDPEQVEEVLAQGAQRARKTAREVLSLVRDFVGLGRSGAAV